MRYIYVPYSGNPSNRTNPTNPIDPATPTNPVIPVNPVDPGNQSGNSISTPQINAATNTVSMQPTGIPITGLILAVLMLLGGLVTSKK